MIENVIGLMPIPVGRVEGLIVNGEERVALLATEQKTIVGLASKGAVLTRASGGLHATSSAPWMIGQIQIMNVTDFDNVREKILSEKAEILRVANKLSRRRKAVDISVREIDSVVGHMTIVELIVDVGDSMGANIVNSMCEAVSPLIWSLSGGDLKLRVLSNLSTNRMVNVKTRVTPDALGGTNILEDIQMAWAFANSDPYRAATHNKGIMNGVGGVLMSTGNDSRSVEAGAHAYAARDGRYRPLSTWKMDEGDLVGELSMPMAVGVIGGAISTHPTAKRCVEIMGIVSATDLGELAASVGLAYNLAVLQMLVTDGIQSVYFPGADEP
jgi:hydroxymethylglutaryl-CoA reductase